MLRHALAILTVSLLLLSCSSVDSFSKRKYLSGARHSTLNLDRNSTPDFAIPVSAPLKSCSETNTTTTPVCAAGESYSLPLCDTSTALAVAVPALHKQELTAQPQDTITKTKKEIRKEKVRSDIARARRSFLGGYFAMGAALVFLLLGLWFGTDGPDFFTNDFVLFILFILLVIPIYFGLLAEAVVLSTLSLAWAHLVRRKHRKEKEYTGKKETRLGIIFSLIAMLVATLGAIIGIPNFLSW